MDQLPNQAADIESDDDIEKVAAALKASGGNIGPEGVDTPLSDDETSLPPEQNNRGQRIRAAQGAQEPAPAVIPDDAVIPDQAPAQAVSDADVTPDLPEPDMSKVKDYFDSRFKGWFPPKALPPQAPSLNTLAGPSPPPPSSPAPHWNPELNVETNEAPPVVSLEDAFRRGFGETYAGMVQNGLPKKHMPLDAAWYQKAAAIAGSEYGDLPYQLAGALPGIVTANPVLGAAGMGGFPALLRSAYADNLRNGSIKSFDDFWPRAASIMTDTLQNAAIMVATEGVNLGLGNLLKDTARPLLATATQQAGMLATMVGMGSAFQGRVPSLSDVGGAAAMLLPLAAFHAFPNEPETPINHPDLTDKLLNVYEKTGLHPAQVLDHAMKEPTVMQDLLSRDRPIPRAYESIVDPDLRGAEPEEVPETESKAAPIFNDKDFPDYPEENVPKEKSDLAMLKYVSERAEKNEPTHWDDLKQVILSTMNPMKEPMAWLGDAINYSNRFRDEVLRPIRNNVFDSAAPVKDVSPEAYQSLVQSWTYAARASEAITGRGIIDKNGKLLSRSMQDILKPFKAANDLDGFKNYLIAAHSAELEKAGINTGADPKDIKATLKAGKAKYDAAALEFGKMMDASLDIAKEAGIASEKGSEASKGRWDYYFPFNRLTEDNEKLPFQQGRKILKTIKGVDEDTVLKIEDPLLAAAKAIDTRFKYSEINIAKQKLEAANTALGEDGFMEKVSPQVQKIELSPKELEELKTEHGLDADTENLAFYRALKTKLQPGQIGVMNDGELSIYQPKEGMQGVTEAMTKNLLDYQKPEANMFVKALSKIATVQREAILGNPLFSFTHSMRQNLMAATLSENGYIPFVHMFQALPHILGKHSDAYHDFMASGGANSSFQDINELMQKDIYGLSKKTGWLDSKWNVVKSYRNANHAVLTAVDNAVRMGEFMQARKGGANIEEAGQAARSVTPNGRVMGAAMRIPNSSVPFMSLELNSYKLFTDAWMKDPKGMAMKTGLWITAPSLLAWYLGKDDPLIQKQPQSEKDTYMMLNIGGHIMKYPRPWSPGILFGALPDRIMDQMYRTGNYRSMFEDLGDTLLHAQPFGAGPVAKGIYEAVNNYDTYRGKPIVQDRVANEWSTSQSSEYTSATAKQLSSWMSDALPFFGKTSHILAPAMIDHQIQNITGHMGQAAVALTDKALVAAGLQPKEVGLGWTLSDNPFMHSYIAQNYSTSTQPIEDFYKHAAENKAFLDTMQAARNDPKSQVNILQRANGYDTVNFAADMNAMRNMQRMYHNVVDNPNISPSDKRQITNGIADRLNAYAESANKRLYEQMVQAGKLKEERQKEMMK